MLEEKSKEELKGFKVVLCYKSAVDIDLLVSDMKELLQGQEYSDSLLHGVGIQTVKEVELYCNRLLDDTYTPLLAQIGVIKLNRLHTEGLSSMSMSGVNESYINDYPDNIKAILKSKRKLKML